MKVLLQKVLTSDVESRYAKKILALFDGKSDHTSSIQQPILDQLSRREIDVLELIAAGRTNQEIANKLVIALGTVKRHIYNIYSKMGVKNRTECVARARVLGLLE